MSERLTSIDLPGVFGSGYADWGRRSVFHMIAELRRKAQHDKMVAEAILKASDGDFHVETYLGIHVRRNLEILQDGKT